MTNTEPLDLDGFDVHKPEIANSHGQELSYCGEDGQHWPCREALIAEVRRLRGEAQGWVYGWMAPGDKEVHIDANADRARICAQAVKGKFMRARPQVWETFELTPATDEETR